MRDEPRHSSTNESGPDCLEGGGEELVLQPQPGGHAGGETLVLAASPDNNVGAVIILHSKSGISWWWVVGCGMRSI